MSEIYEAIKKMSQGCSTADVGKVTSVDEEAGRCDVEIEGKAPAMGAWLRCGSEGMGVEVIPEVGSEAVVVWMNDVLAVVVSVEKAAKVVMRGGENGGLVKVEELVDRLNKLEEDANSLKTKLTAWTPVAQDGGAALKAAISGWVSSKLAKTTREDIEDELITH